MVVGVLSLELILHAPHSLKEKRGIVRSLLGRIRSRFPVSAAEVDLHDLWQRSRVGFTMVGVDEAEIDRTFHRLEEEVERSGLAEISDRHYEILHY